MYSQGYSGMNQYGAYPYMQQYGMQPQYQYAAAAAAYPQQASADPKDETQWRSLYVGNLPTSMPDMLLYEIFATIAPVANWKIIKDKTSGKSQGYGFVDYYDHESAKVALESLNGRKIMDNEVKVNWAHIANGNREDAANMHTIFVGDLSGEVTDKVLRKAFSKYGEVTDARVMMDSNTGRSRGFGFVSYRTRAEAEQAMGQMNGEWLGSRAIRTNWANQKSQSENVEAIAQSIVENNTSVYVGNIPTNTTDDMLKQLFSEFSPYIEQIRLHKGYAFVQFKSHDQAKQAITLISGRCLGDKSVKCGWGKERQTTTPTAAPGAQVGPVAYPAAYASASSGYSAYSYGQGAAGVDSSSSAMGYYPQYYGAQYYGGSQGAAGYSSGSGAGYNASGYSQSGSQN